MNVVLLSGSTKTDFYCYLYAGACQCSPEITATSVLKLFLKVERMTLRPNTVYLDKPVTGGFLAYHIERF